MLHPYDAITEQAAEQWVSAAENWSGGLMPWSTVRAYCIRPSAVLDQQQEELDQLWSSVMGPWRLTVQHGRN